MVSFLLLRLVTKNLISKSFKERLISSRFRKDLHNQIISYKAYNSSLHRCTILNISSTKVQLIFLMKSFKCHKLRKFNEITKFLISQNIPPVFNNQNKLKF